MIKFYLLFFLFSLHIINRTEAQKHHSASSGSIVIHLDDSKYGNIDLGHAFVVLDKYDRTGAGIIRGNYEVTNKKITIDDVPVGKYFVDLYTTGHYRQHIILVVKAGKKTNSYNVKLDNIVYVPNDNDNSIYQEARYTSNR